MDINRLPNKDALPPLMAGIHADTGKLHWFLDDDILWRGSEDVTADLNLFYVSREGQNITLDAVWWFSSNFKWSMTVPSMGTDVDATVKKIAKTAEEYANE